MPFNPSFANAPSGTQTTVLGTTSIPFGSTGTLGVVDFSKQTARGVTLTPAQIAGRMGSLGAPYGVGMSPNYSGAYLAFTNDSDCALSVTFQNSGLVAGPIPPGHQFNVPIPPNEEKAAVSVVYGNPAIRHPAATLVVMFYDATDVAAGHLPAEGIINPSAGGAPTGWFDITAYGASPALANNAPAIQAAYNAALSYATANPGAGAIVYTPPVGVFTLTTSGPNVQADNIAFCGGGWGSQWLAGAPNITLLKFSASGIAGQFRYGAAVSDMYFEGGSLAGVTALQLVSTYYALLQHVRVRHCLGIGVDLQGIAGAVGAYTHILSCTITDGGAGTGINTSNHEFNTIRDSSLVFYNGAGGVGIYLRNGNTVVDGCIFDECDTSLRLDFTHNNTLMNNQFTRGLTSFIYLHGAKSTRVAGNYFGTFAGVAGSQSILLVDNGGNQDNLVENNQVDSFGTQWPKFVGETGMGAGGQPGNLYLGNSTNGLPSTLQTGTLRSNPGFNPLETLSAPAAPVPTTTPGAGNVPPGTYGVVVTLLNAFGETVGSASGSVTLAATGNIAVPIPIATGNATAWNVYITQAGGVSPTLQNGAPLSFQSTYSLVAVPTNTGAAPPVTNTTAGFAQPAVPASGVAFENTTGVDVMIYLAGGTVTAVSIGATQVASTTPLQLRLPSRQTVTLVYTVPPTWVWVGE